jgi:hypothetical protein
MNDIQRATPTAVGAQTRSACRPFGIDEVTATFGAEDDALAPATPVRSNPALQRRTSALFIP